jgi:hypothetical protein
MSFNGCCNKFGGFTPCNFNGVPHPNNLPLAKFQNVNQIFFDEEFPLGVFNPATFTFYNFNGQGDHDGVITPNPNAPGILVTAESFADTTVVAVDHVKFLTFQNTVIPVTDDGLESVIESQVAGEQIFSNINLDGPCSIDVSGNFPSAYTGYVRDAQEDIRLCGAALTTIDMTTLMVADFFFSNNIGYAFYERLPNAKTLLNNYWAFSHAIPIFVRSNNTPINDFYNIQIAWTPTTVRWLVDGVEVYKVERLGLPIDEKFRIINHGGVAPNGLTVAGIQGGFGLFTLVDASLPNNYSRNLGPQPLTNLNQVQGFVPANTAASPVGLASLVAALATPVPTTSYAPDYYPVGGSFPLTNVAPQIGASPAGLPATAPTARAFLVDGTTNSCFRIWGQGAAIALQYLKGYRRAAC